MYLRRNNLLLKPDAPALGMRKVHTVNVDARLLLCAMTNQHGRSALRLRVVSQARNAAAAFALNLVAIQTMPLLRLDYS